MSTLEVPTTLGYRLLSKKQVAEFLGLTTKTIERMVTARKIPHVLLPTATGTSKRLRFIDREIDAWVDKQHAAIPATQNAEGN